MLSFTDDQFSHFSLQAEQDFVLRLLAYLERNCPAELPEDRAERIAFVETRIAAAREKGLTWQLTIAEHVRLSTLRASGRRVVDPNRLLGDKQRAADTQFAEHIRRAKVLGRVGGR